MNINILSTLKKIYKNPCKINGRSSRKEYILFLLTFFISFYILYFLTLQKPNFAMSIMIFIFLAISTVISFCLTIRRLHDLNFNGYWAVVTIPLLIIGFIVEIKTYNSIYFELVIFYSTIQTLLLCFFKGTPGVNKYGEPPGE